MIGKIWWCGDYVMTAAAVLKEGDGKEGKRFRPEFRMIQVRGGKGKKGEREYVCVWGGGRYTRRGGGARERTGDRRRKEGRKEGRAGEERKVGGGGEGGVDL